MRPISYTLICIGLILAAAVEGFFAGILLFLVIDIVIFHRERSIGDGLLIIFIAGACTLLSPLFQFPFLWKKVRPDLPNPRVDGNLD